jgi:hypothetical protein
MLLGEIISQYRFYFRSHRKYIVSLSPGEVTIKFEESEVENII